MDGVYRFVNAVGRTALRALAVDVRWTGLEHLPRSGPVVLAATHVGYPDFVLVERAAVTAGRYVRFLTRHDVWDAPGVGWFMDRMRHIPVDRRTPAYTYLRARRELEAGEAVCGFPEAGISYSHTVRSLMPGVAALARETGAPLVPVAIWGSQRIASVGDPARPADLTRHRRVDLAFGAPLHLDRDADVVDATRTLGHTLTVLLERLQVQPHHRPLPGESAPWYPAHLGGQAPGRHRARELDVVPFNAVTPTWGPDLDAYADG